MNPNYVGPERHSLDYGVIRIRRSTDLYRKDILPIIGLDPGGTTGWSLIVLHRNAFDGTIENALKTRVTWLHGQVDCRGVNAEDEGVYQLRKLIDEWPWAAVVIEDFILRPARKESSRNLLSPVRITAKLEHHLWMRDREMILQQPSLAKRLDDERLKALNVYTREGGMQHARDADRHVLMFMRRCMDGSKGRVLQQNTWPWIFGG